MLGVFVNAISVLVLGLLGSFVGDKFPKSIQDSIMKFLPVCVLIIGVRSSLEGEIIVVIISIVLGVAIGELLKIDDRINKFTDFIKNRFINPEDTTFSEGFITTSLIFCVGSMGILGCIDAGVKGDNDILFAKAVMDGLTAFFFATTFGKGVSFSAIPVFIYQGILVVLSGFLLPVFTPEVAANLSGTGGVMIIAICFYMLKLVDFKLANLTPAIFIPIIYGLILKFM
ncbi:DUF554 domain-containing protein [Peptoniphilus sp. SGI.035]|uniref:DUF554 domain-containing protein n=1 Tax=Peptoniphilus sp. SGI.035 TaxID=3420564 RepID=UPI003D072D5F